MSASQARLWFAAAATLLVCAGCGFKGPLYLPERNATVVTHPAPTEGAPAPEAQSRGAKEGAKEEGKPPAPAAIAAVRPHSSLFAQSIG
jgi:predicted small lipoprotein YifL